MSHEQRMCHLCGETEGRDATLKEIISLKAPYKVFKEYRNGKWTGNNICQKCNSRILGQERRKETAPIPSNIEECRAKHSIILRIVRGLPACIEKGSVHVVHQGTECRGCSIENGGRK